MKKIIASLAASAALASAAFGQVAITAFNSAYTQNFNSLTTAGTWTDNTTLLGWYARTTNTATSSFGLNTGATTTAGFYSYGVAGVNPATDRALGFHTSNAYTGTAGSGQNFIGLRLTNSTGASATSFALSYTGEQWRRDNTVTQNLTVQYAFGATGVMDSGVTWTTITALGFASPNIVGTAAALDGNDNANSAALSATVSTTWANGAELWIRWVDLNDSGNDHVLAIDNVSLTAIPEPSTYAAIFGALALFGVVLQRRRAVGRP